MDVAVKGIIPRYFTNELAKLGIEVQTQAGDADILMAGCCNYLGVNWYCTTIVEAKREVPEKEFIFKRMERITDEDLMYTDWGWNNDPMGFTVWATSIDGSLWRYTCDDY